MAALQAVVRSGVTAAAVIHQPSWETCLLFDELLLLGKGGRTGGIWGFGAEAGQLGLRGTQQMAAWRSWCVHYTCRSNQNTCLTCHAWLPAA